MKIIAEIGSNFKTFDDCIFSIKMAKECGANIVKFQFIEPGDLHPDSKKALLPKDWIPLLADYCNKIEIEFMCSAFSVKGYEFIDRYVQRHKVASCEASDRLLLESINQFGKPVLISSGCLLPEEMKSSIELLSLCEVTLMFCCSKYPAYYYDFSLIGIYKEILSSSISYGYSDHTLDPIVHPVVAQDLGCTFIEKHVNFISGLLSDDSPNSIGGYDFEKMCLIIRRQPHLIKFDFDTRRAHVRCLIAKSDIKSGERVILGENAIYARVGTKCGGMFVLPDSNVLTKDVVKHEVFTLDCF